jgi:hypothetical protein
MRVELLPGLENVVRFPVERRRPPTLGLLREIAPDVREVSAYAEGFFLDMPPLDLRHQVDAETARHIAEQFGAGAVSASALDEFLAPVLAGAIAACREVHDKSQELVAAQQALLRAQTAGHFWIDPLRERADELTRRVVELLIMAYTRAEQAEGVARAVAFARRGEAWVPWDIRAEEEALFGAAACRAG